MFNIYHGYLFTRISIFFFLMYGLGEVHEVHAMESKESLRKLLVRAIIWRNTVQALECIEKGAEVSSQIGMGDTPLHLACSVGCAEIAERLVAAGADINAVSDDGRTPLMSALKFGKADLARWLMKLGANVGLRDVNGKSALEYVQESDSEAVKPLVDQIEYRMKERG